MPATLSCRTTAEFAEETNVIARFFGMSRSDYVREAIREKNERAMAERIVFLSRTLSAESVTFNDTADDSLGDGLA